MALSTIAEEVADDLDYSEARVKMELSDMVAEGELIESPDFEDVYFIKGG